MEKIKRHLDYNNFLKAIDRKRNEKPDHLPFYEHIASGGFIRKRLEMTGYDPGAPFMKSYVEFWTGMGYDVVPIEASPFFKLPEVKHSEGALTHASEEYVVFRNREDFENYEWPSLENPFDYTMLEEAAKYLPDGVKLVAGVCAGIYEWASKMMGTIGMSYLMMDDPELVGEIFEKIGQIHIASNKIIAQMDFVCAHRQGDDLGFKTSTFLPPDLLRKWVFPVYKKMASIAHEVGRPFVLHSCGNLKEVYDDIIECGVDAKHSFEETIMPVHEFKKVYGDMITPLGGLDVDFICRRSKEEIREYTIKHIEKCYYDGHWALGMGNSLTNYMPVENYITVLNTAIEVLGK